MLLTEGAGSEKKQSTALPCLHTLQTLHLQFLSGNTRWHSSANLFPCNTLQNMISHMQPGRGDTLPKKNEIRQRGILKVSLGHHVEVWMVHHIGHRGTKGAR